MKWTDNRVGALWMMGSMAAFTFNDTAFKLAAADVSFYQAIFVRGIFATLTLGALAYAAGAFRVSVSAKDWRRMLIRTLAELVAVYCFLAALLHMPLANITAVIQILPLTLALAAALFLAEPIGPRRLLAILIGFLGVMCIIQPGTDGFNAYALLGLVAVAAVTVRDLIVRSMSASVPTLLIAFVASSLIMLWAGGMHVVTSEVWVSLSPGPLLLLMTAALFVFAAYYCSIAAMRVGEVAMVTPFRYSVMIWAVALGWLIFGEVPDALTFGGIALITLAGLYTLHRSNAD